MNAQSYFLFLACFLLTQTLSLEGAETYNFSAATKIPGSYKLEFTADILSSKIQMSLTPYQDMPFCSPSDYNKTILFSPGRIFFKMEDQVISLLEVILYLKRKMLLHSPRGISIEKVLEAFFKKPPLSGFIYTDLLAVPATTTPFVPLFISHDLEIETKN